MRKYVKKVKRTNFSHLPGMIEERFDSPELDPILKMVVCHKIMYDKAQYHRSGRKVQNPDKFLKGLSGDCEDHSVTLAAMMHACGLEVALTVVSIRNSNNHILVQVKNPLSNIEATCDAIRRVYYRQFDKYAEEIGYDYWKGNFWIVADTAGSEKGGWTSYLGDLDSYEPNVIYRQENGGWQWRRVKNRVKIN